MTKENDTLKPLIEILKIHPTWNFSEFCEHTGNTLGINSKRWTNVKYTVTHGKRKRTYKKRKYKKRTVQSVVTKVKKNKWGDKYAAEKEYILKNPENTYLLFNDDCPKSKISSSYFAGLRYRTLKKNPQVTLNTSPKKFKPTIMNVIAHMQVPEFKTKDEVLNWINTDILTIINTSQSSSLFTMSTDFNNNVELRMQPKK
jgi:hypothetical protein